MQDNFSYALTFQLNRLNLSERGLSTMDGLFKQIFDYRVCKMGTISARVHECCDDGTRENVMERNLLRCNLIHNIPVSYAI